MQHLHSEYKRKKTGKEYEYQGHCFAEIRHILFRSFAKKKLFKTFLAPSCIEIFNFVFFRTLYLFDDRMLKEGGSRFKQRRKTFSVAR